MTKEWCCDLGVFWKPPKKKREKSFCLFFYNNNITAFCRTKYFQTRTAFSSLSTQWCWPNPNVFAGQQLHTWKCLFVCVCVSVFSVSSGNIVPCSRQWRGPLRINTPPLPPGCFSHRSENFCTGFLVIRCGGSHSGKLCGGRLVKLETACCLFRWREND